MPKISPHAVVDPHAQVADSVEIGPFCVVGPDVVIGDGCRLVSSVTLMGRTTLGTNNLIYPNVVLGGAPQDKKYKGAPTSLVVGNDNVFREAVTIHRGSEKGGGITRVGNGNYLMVNCHMGHDVQFGSNCILANNVMVAGHVIVGDYANMAGGVGIHHFVTVGEYAFIGGYSRIHHDVPPFCKIDGADLVRGINTVGLRRAGLGDPDVEALEVACRELFYSDKPFATAMVDLSANPKLNGYVKRLLDFLRLRDCGRHGRYLESKRK